MQDKETKIVTEEQARIRWLKSLEQRDGKKFFSSGFKCHDQVAGRLLRGSQYIVAARPGVGKTAFLISLSGKLYIRRRDNEKLLLSNRWSCPQPRQPFTNRRQSLIRVSA